LAHHSTVIQRKAWIGLLLHRDQGQDRTAEHAIVVAEAAVVQTRRYGCSVCRRICLRWLLERERENYDLDSCMLLWWKPGQHASRISTLSYRFYCAFLCHKRCRCKATAFHKWVRAAACSKRARALEARAAHHAATSLLRKAVRGWDSTARAAQVKVVRLRQAGQFRRYHLTSVAFSQWKRVLLHGALSPVFFMGRKLALESNTIGVQHDCCWGFK
jgi:hypothetical protein